MQVLRKIISRIAAIVRQLLSQDIDRDDKQATLATKVPISRDLLNQRVAGNWRQGMTFEPLKEISNEISESHRIIVATQTCDLLNPNIEAEPNVEVLVGYIYKGSVPLDNGKSFREFSLSFDSAVPNYLQMKIHERYFVPRDQFLLQAIPTTHQPLLREQRQFSRWLGERYTRPAYPDSFVNALNANKGKGSKIIEKSLRQLVSAHL